MSAAALLGFAPFAAFALIEKLVGIVPGLASGLAVSLVLVAWGMLRHRSVSVLEIGSAAIFALLIILALRDQSRWSIWEVRLYVDGALAGIVVLGVLLRRPFTMQHGRKIVSADAAEDPDFLRHNIILTAFWGLAFAALASVDLYMTVHTGARDRLGIILSLAILATAVHFTQAYLRRLPHRR